MTVFPVGSREYLFLMKLTYWLMTDNCSEDSLSLSDWADFIWMLRHGQFIFFYSWVILQTGIFVCAWWLADIWYIFYFVLLFCWVWDVALWAVLSHIVVALYGWPHLRPDLRSFPNTCSPLLLPVSTIMSHSIKAKKHKPTKGILKLPNAMHQPCIIITVYLDQYWV